LRTPTAEAINANVMYFQRKTPPTLLIEDPVNRKVRCLTCISVP